MDEYMQRVNECAEQGKALARMMAADGRIEPLYLYHRPSKAGQAGRLYLVRDGAPVPPDVEPTTKEGLKGNVPYENYFQWVYNRARRAPILATVKA